MLLMERIILLILRYKQIGEKIHHDCFDTLTLILLACMAALNVKKGRVMKKCVKVTFSAPRMPKGFLQEQVQKHAKKHGIEGTAQSSTTQEVRIIACGDKDKVDDFLDTVHAQIMRLGGEGMTTEPFVKDKDYRGVFRVIE